MRRIVWGIAALAFATAIPSSSYADEDDVVVSADPKKPAAPSSAAQKPSIEERLLQLEKEHDELKKELAKTKSEGAIPAFLRAFTVGGYIQGEYQNHQDSSDQVAQGALLNKDRFLLRRARLKVDGDWRFAHAQLEIDANTVSGPILRPQHAFARAQLPPLDPKVADVPIAAFTIGLFDTPFGYELVESPKTRWFMERSLSSRAFFAAEPDLGMMFHGGLSFVRWSVAMMNGQPLDTKGAFPTLSPTGQKDLVLRAGVDTHPNASLDVAGGVSALRGRGFHAGSDATKNMLVWRDVHEDGTVDQLGLTGAPGTAAIASQTFERWMIGADLRATLRTRFGATSFTGEVTVAQNMDRNLYVADPVLTSINARELGLQLGVTQEITKWGLVGFRYDYYDPNGDFFDNRQGRLIPTVQSIHTFSPLVALTWPERARLIFQYDIIRDHFARDARGIPADLKNDTFTLRLQVNL